MHPCIPAVLMFLLPVFTKTIVASAQSTEISFLKRASHGFEVLSPEQYTQALNLKNQRNVDTFFFVEIGNLAAIQQNGELDMDIPGTECTAKIEAKRVESYENGAYYWYGEVSDAETNSEMPCRCSEGSVSIFSEAGVITGSFRIDDHIYELQDLGAGKWILLSKVFDGTLLKCDTTAQNNRGNHPQSSVTDRNNNCPVRVLALFTPAARSAVPSITGTINLAIKETNQAFYNSGIPVSDLQLNLVAIRRINFTETTNPAADLNAAIANTTIQALRDSMAADIVVLFVHANYGGTIGIAGTLTLEPERAFCLVEVEEATSEYTTAHEIGHLFGCRHEPSADPTGPFEHAHDFTTPCSDKRRNTIMFSTATGNTIQHYSNPDVRFKGAPTGIRDARHNARQLSEEACTVANFRNDASFPVLNAYITGPDYGCTCYGVTLYASVSGGAPGPYTYAWQISEDGFNWGPVLNNSAVFTLLTSCEQERTIFVRLRIASVDNQVVFVFHSVKPYNDPYTCGWYPEERSGRSHRQLTVVPNPTTGLLFLRLPSAQGDEPAEISILDVTGRVVLKKVISSTDNSDIQIDISLMPPNPYLLRIKTFTHVETIKIIKQ